MDLKIILVDDSLDCVQSLALLLSRRGCTVRTATTAETALRIALEFLPQAAGLDIGMPVMDGYELAARLRAIGGLANIAIVANSGYAANHARMQAAGIDAHLLKPVSALRLLEVMCETNHRRTAGEKSAVQT